MNLTPTQRAIATAIEIATWPPLRRESYTSSAKVPWLLIEELRERLDAAGIDWREVRKHNRNEERRRRRDWSLPDDTTRETA